MREEIRGNTKRQTDTQLRDIEKRDLNTWVSYSDVINPHRQPAHNGQQHAYNIIAVAFQQCTADDRLCRARVLEEQRTTSVHEDECSEDREWID